MKLNLPIVMHVGAVRRAGHTGPTLTSPYIVIRTTNGSHVVNEQLKAQAMHALAAGKVINAPTTNYNNWSLDVAGAIQNYRPACTWYANIFKGYGPKDHLDIYVTFAPIDYDISTTARTAR